MDKSEKIIAIVCEKAMPILNEYQQRILAGCLADGYGHGGKIIVSRHSSLSRNTVAKGVKEIHSGDTAHQNTIRKAGAGRKPSIEKNPELLGCVDSLLQETTYGDPMRIITYSTLSLRKIACAVGDALGIEIGKDVISRLLESLGYSKQRNQKMEQLGDQHPDRDAQFRHINETGKAYIASGDPFISVDCKKKENIGNFMNAGAEYRHTEDPRQVLDHDFPIKELGKVAPYGIYTVNDNTGFINLGTDKDTPEFAVQSVRTWWYDVGQWTFPEARRLYITADGGGSNSSRSRLWKQGLARLAEETGLAIEVSHFPPGTSKWNKVEHRLFCYITANWAGQPLVDVATAVRLIGSTTTTAGLKVICKLDEKSYPTGIKVTDKDFDKIDIKMLSINNGWNYIIKGFKCTNN